MVRMIATGVVCCSLTAVWPQGQEGSAPPTENLVRAVTFETAKELAGKGRLDQAMAELDQLSKQTPEPAGVERLRGMIFYQREQFPPAIAAFAKAAEQDPRDSESLDLMNSTSLLKCQR